MSDWSLHVGDCMEQLRDIEPNSIDAVVTDPPYGLGFMGKEWDSPGRAARQTTTAVDAASSPYARGRAEYGGASYGNGFLVATRGFQAWTEGWALEVLRVLKPGGHLVAFGGTRTYHRLTVGIEDAGFEIRDCLVWLYGSGFPKSRNLGDGWGTALKPGHEPIVLARKPIEGSATANHQRYGTGGINVDACRIPFRDEADERESKDKNRHSDFGSGVRENTVYNREQRSRADQGNYDPVGRWPANVAVDVDAAALLDEQTGNLSPGRYPGAIERGGLFEGGIVAGGSVNGGSLNLEGGGASRFFYSAKASAAERIAGAGSNDHPTVKPIDLMRWLVRLVTPAGGLVLDPFTGSGTTGIAAILEHLRFVGIEREPAYADIATARIAHWERHRPHEQLGFDL